MWNTLKNKSMYLVVWIMISMGIISSLMLLDSNARWNAHIRENVPLRGNISQARADMLEGQLQLERLIAGDSSVRSQDVWPYFKQALLEVEDCINGKSNIAYLGAVIPTDPILLDQLVQLREIILEVTDDAKKIWEHREKKDLKASFRQRASFYKMEQQIESVIFHTDKNIIETVKSQGEQSNLLFGLLVFSFFISSISVSIIARKKVQAEAELKKSHSLLEEKVEERTARLKTEKLRAEQYLDTVIRNQQLLKEMGKTSKVGGWDFNLDTRSLEWTEEVYRIHEVGLDYVPTVENALDFYSDTSKPVISDAVQRAIDHGEPFDLELEIITAKENLRHVHAIGTADLEHRRVHGIFQDITEQKKAKEEKLSLEEQLHQSQKVESIGRLAGGVAHDYNNMLSVIIGNVELAQMKAARSAPLNDNLDQILQAANRSRDITHQLLAFARKQIINPKVLNLNDAVESMITMLRSLLGENIDLRWQPKADVWPVKLDPSQLDQALANLCLNARDAITDVGKVTIETETACLDEDYCKDHPGFTPGNYVLLSVSDDGSGMDKETLDNIFEPFFTTKKQGEGTGLGMAMVYGIVKQSGGFINAYSEPNQGTTFKIYIPRYEGEDAVSQETDIIEAQKGQGETVLLVEDEKAIVDLTTAMLEELGYRVLAANSPAEALNLLQEDQGEIQLLLTDVVMPGMNGRELTKQVQEIHPKIKTLYMSGYTANVIAHHGVLDEGINFIHKPFSRRDLSMRVREILDSNQDA